MREERMSKLFLEENGGRLGQIPRPLIQWYRKNARVLPWRENPVPYAVWISEIMLQQTRVEAVKEYFARFLTTLPTIAHLAEAEDEVLLKLWEGLGYYSRVRNLKKAARQVMEEFGGNLPADYGRLLTLPGIGRYTAGAIASIAFGLDVPAVDGNVIRVIARYLAWEGDSSSEGFKRDLEEALLPHLPAGQCGDFNQALMELGATVCLPNGMPKCDSCPLRGECAAHLQQNEMAYPVKTLKKARRIEKRTIFVVTYEGKYGLHRRDTEGLLAGMWELPGEEGHLSPEEATAFLQRRGVSLQSLQPLPAAVHIFSHVEWRMIGYRAEIKKIPSKGDWEWFSAEEIDGEIALPSAFRGYRGELRL